jgi:hypothetical protein
MDSDQEALAGLCHGQPMRRRPPPNGRPTLALHKRHSGRKSSFSGPSGHFYGKGNYGFVYHRIGRCDRRAHRLGLTHSTRFGLG